MGKGDKKTKRGKIFAGSFGKSRLKLKTILALKKEKGLAEAKDSKPKKKAKKKAADVKKPKAKPMFSSTGATGFRKFAWES